MEERLAIMARSDTRCTPLLRGFLYEIQQLNSRAQKWRGRRGILDGGRSKVGFERRIGEDTRECHLYFPDDRKSLWMRPYDLVLVQGQADGFRVGDWVDFIYYPRRDETAQLMHMYVQIDGFGCAGAYLGAVWEAIADHQFVQFALMRGSWNANMMVEATERGADGVALLSSWSTSRPSDEKMQPRAYEPKPVLRVHPSGQIGSVSR